MSKWFQRREPSPPLSLKLDSQFIKKVTSLLHQARVEVDLLFESWWISRVGRVEKEALARNISAQVNYVRQIQTVYECARALAINARVNAVISAAMHELVPDNDPQMLQLISHLLGDYLDADAPKQVEYRNIVAAYHINPATLATFFAAQPV